MSETPYQNREIQELFKAADARADAFHDKLMERMSVFEDNTTESLDRIELQTTTINGRVGRLENWRAFITGGMAVIVIIVVPLLGWALYVLSNIQGQVHKAVDDALAAYNITN